MTESGYCYRMKTGEEEDEETCLTILHEELWSDEDTSGFWLRTGALCANNWLQDM